MEAINRFATETTGHAPGTAFDYVITNWVVVQAILEPVSGVPLRDLMDEGEFLEVFIDTPIEVCRQRAPKGLYAKADSGELKNFTGVDSPYEAPESAELAIDTTLGEPQEHAEKIVEMLKERGIID